MTKEASRVVRFWGFVIHSSFVIRASSFSRHDHADRKTLRPGNDTSATAEAFTLVELLVVIAIIIVLAGLILATTGYVQKKAARSRAEAEIAAISAALESYRADNGIYPRDTTNQTTDNLDTRASGNPSNYQSASLYLYTQLSGNGANRQALPNARSYFAFKPNQLSPTDQSQSVQFVRDPFGNSYGYSTANQANSSQGYNPTFDLWSTGGDMSGDQNQWIKNW